MITTQLSGSGYSTFSFGNRMTEEDPVKITEEHVAEMEKYLKHAKDILQGYKDGIIVFSDTGDEKATWLFENDITTVVYNLQGMTVYKFRTPEDATAFTLRWK